MSGADPSCYALVAAGSIEKWALFPRISADGRLPSDVRVRLRVEVARGEVIAHLLVGGLDEPRVFDDLLDLFGGSVAADVLLLRYVSQVCPVADAVANVLEDLPLSLGTGPMADENLPDRSLFLRHASSFRFRDAARILTTVATVSRDSKSSLRTTNQKAKERQGNGSLGRKRRSGVVAQL
jgi:hypothetical protein